MPIYEFKCNKCGEKFEKLVNLSESISDIHCPKCQSVNPQKLLSLFSSVASSESACDSSGTT